LWFFFQVLKYTQRGSKAGDHIKYGIIIIIIKVIYSWMNKYLNGTNLKKR